MSRRDRLIRAYAVAIVGSVVFFTVAYDAGMSLFENRPRSLLDSFEVVLQTLTTTGYGQDAPWGTEMTLLVVTMEIASIVLIFAAFPILVVPLVKDALATTPPTAMPDLSDHVIVCGHSSRAETLVAELDSVGVEYVLVESDRADATDLQEQGVTVVHGDPETVEALRDVEITEARALVADAGDDVNLSILMAATEVADVPAYSVVTDPEQADYHERAGADEVFSPRALLGQGLAGKVSPTVDADLGDIELGDRLSIAEVPVHPGSALLGKQVGETDIADRSGVTIIGAWASGEFRTPPFPDLRLDEHTVLLVVGDETTLDQVRRLTQSSLQRYRRGTVVVCGYGIVGETVNTQLAGEDVDRTVVDLDDDPSVDVVGDVTDPATLRSAGVSEASTVVLALDDDTTTLLATFVVREVAPDVEVVARADETGNVRKLYRAGSDYVLSLASVTGRLIASTVVADEDVVSVGDGIEVVRVDPGPLAGKTFGEVEVQERTGCTVVAVERRDGRVDTDIYDWTEFGEHDHLVLAGTERDVTRFHEQIGGSG
jgi:Trk K+ transport system NAD-binding subunit